MSEIWRCDLHVRVHPDLLSGRGRLYYLTDCGCTDNHQAIAFQIGEAHPTYIGLVAVFLWTVVGEVLFGYATFVLGPRRKNRCGRNSSRADLDLAMPFGHIACSG